MIRMIWSRYIRFNSVAKSYYSYLKSQRIGSHTIAFYNKNVWYSHGNLKFLLLI